MFHVAITITIFLSVVLLHIAWCRVNKKNALLTVPFLFLAVIGFATDIALIYFYSPAQPHNTLWEMPVAASSVLTYFLLVPAYYVLYFGTKVKSPTQKIFLLLQARDSVTLKDLTDAIGNQDIVIPRIGDLERSQCISFKENSYRLTAYGLIVARFLNVYQAIIGRGIGG